MNTYKLRLFVCLLLAALCWHAHSHETITVIAFEYPPIYQNDTDKGLSGDLVIAAFNAAEIDAELQFYPVNRMVNMIANGEAICGIGGAVLFEKADIAKKVNVSSVIQYVSQVFFYDQRKYPSGIKYNNLEDLSKYRIGALLSSGVMKFLEKKLSIDPNRTHEGSAKQLQMGRIDLWAVVDLTGLKYMKNLFPSEAAEYRYSKPFTKGDVSIVFSKARDPDGLYNTKFKEGLATIKKNGTYMKIMAKYYGGKDQINKESLPQEMR